jgi:hypothetical protein
MEAKPGEDGEGHGPIKQSSEPDIWAEVNKVSTWTVAAPGHGWPLTHDAPRAGRYEAGTGLAAPLGRDLPLPCCRSILPY